MVVRIGIVENETAVQGYVRSLIEAWAVDEGHCLQLLLPLIGDAGVHADAVDP